MTPNQYVLRDQPAQPLAALVGGVIVILIAAALLAVGSTTGGGAHHATRQTGTVAAPHS
jgi:hypothetical protein